ncbi:hypothetical protein KDRO_A03360 [Kluyveromyces lactis]|nr:hypothetical protein KDRO_A03360 [Kluyveromyces lactis]
MTTTRQSNLVLPPISTLLPPQYFNSQAIHSYMLPSTTYPNASVPYSKFNQLSSPEHYSSSSQRYTTTGLSIESNVDSSSTSSSSSSSVVYSLSSSPSLDGLSFGSQSKPRRGSNVVSGMGLEMNGISAGHVHSQGTSSTHAAPQIYHQPTGTSSMLSQSGITIATNNNMIRPAVGSTNSYYHPPLHHHNTCDNRSRPHSHKNGKQHISYAQRHHNSPTTVVKGKASGKADICAQCGKQFTRPSALRTHMLVHSGDKPFECTWEGCNKKFNVKSNLIRHLKLHK